MLNKNPTCNFPCTDVNKDRIIPRFKADSGKIRLVMISEAPPVKQSDYYYENSSGSFFQTTRMAFQDAGYNVNSYDDLTKLGIYLTTAIKCSKKDYLVSPKTIKECSALLEKELEKFPNIRVIMCMGDFAIKAVNHIFKSKFKINPIRPGSTYKIRALEHMLNNIRFFPSYTQTGESFNLEKSKRKMIAEDIRKAMDLLK